MLGDVEDSSATVKYGILNTSRNNWARARGMSRMVKLLKHTRYNTVITMLDLKVNCKHGIKQNMVNSVRK